MLERKCYSCGNTIKECMGFVATRDFLAQVEEKEPVLLRELCGKCATSALFFPERFTGILDLQDMQVTYSASS